jgi:monoamine oxidase
MEELLGLMAVSEEVEAGVRVEEHDVVVIGAGVAGLACASSFMQAGVDYVILEAANRMGGRVRTDYSVAKRPFEVGALMIHGKQVVTHAWLREFGLHARPLPMLQCFRFSRNGKIERLPISIRNLLHPTIGLRAMYQGGVILPKKLMRYTGPDISLEQFLEQEHPLPGARLLVELLEAHAAAADLDTVGVRGSASEAAVRKEEFGYSNFQVVEGYEALLSRRVNSLAERVRLRTRVSTIRQCQGGVRIEAEDESERTAEFRAKRAIITLPLGVLKTDTVTFDPPLPDNKRRAINAIGFGNAMVVLLRLQGGNLVERLGDFGALWGGGPTSFHRPYVATKDPPRVLQAFMVGREAVRRASLSDLDVVEATKDELRSILPPSVDPGEIGTFAVERWVGNPFVKGGYSFLPKDATLDDRLELASCEDDVLFFAGEATNTEGEAGTVHGAIETGYRAAEQVIRSLHPR